MAQVHNKGLTQLYDGNSIIGEPPKVNIVFIHGLGGHPRRTWSAEYSTAGSDLGGRRSSADTSSTGRKNSTTGWSRFLKRSNTGTPVSLADRSNSIVPSVISTEEPVSPRQIFENPSAMEPEIAPTPALSTNKKSVYWPQDLLPQDFPDARIYTFGYDSKVATMSSTGQRAKLTFTQHAHDLHMTLNKELDDVTPIILCAHSLGGVLSKRALWESKTANNPELQKLARLTKVIIFFGTPHKGARKARFGEIATQVVSMAKLDTAQHLVSSLKLDSEILDIIHADFLKLLRAGDFYVHTFSEGRSINSTFGKIVEEYSSRIDEVSELQMHEVIDGDHRTMIQYKGAQDPGYRKVVSALKHYMNKLDKKHDIERVSLASMASSRDIPTRTYISVPHERNEETFVGRKDCIDAINMLFLGPKHTPFVVLHGLGGIGKTQVAIELAYRFKHSSPLFSVFWVHAQTAQTLDEGFRKILETLEIPHSAETNVRTAVAEWLRNKMNGRWLLVVDNVDDLSVLDENNGKGRQFKLLSCLPKTDHGHVLFTTRYRTLAVKITKEVVRLDQMSKTESMELLKRSLAGQYDESEEHLAEQLLEELSYIPLAISQAAGYMFEAENTIAQYLEYYRESEETRMELLQQGIVDLQMEDEGTDVLEDEDEEDESKGPKTVLKTSWMSFKRMKSDTATGPLANDLLSIMAFLNRQEIPLSLLKKYRPKAPSLKLNDAFKLLKGYSLVIENTKTNTFSMHRLVQFSLRKWLEKDGKAGQYQKDSLTVLSNNFPDGSFKTWDECKPLIVHADTILEHSTDTDDRAARAKLLQNCANFQNARGQYAAAEEKIQEVVKLRTELVGADNTETLRATDQLAWTLWNQAKKDESLALAQRTLMKKEQLFGKRSVEALTTSHIVATVVGGQGKHQEAAKIHEENIEARNELLGPEHLDTLRSASSLSLELWQLGQFVKAEDLARRTLASREKLLGEEHPDTLEIAGTLGFILEIQGKLVEAEDLKSKMLNTRLNIYGEDHPDTADSYHDMGWIYHQMGRYDDAEPYYENALSAKLRLLGDTHWKTLTTFCNYPVFCCDKGEYDEAEERSKRLIAIFKRVQGDMHPQTLDATGGLAVILRHQGKLEEAAQAARTSIDGRNVVLGPDHPWTLPPVSHWGYILTLQGDHKQGEQVIREALAGLEKSMGKKHNNVLTSLLFLSKNLLRQSTGPEDPVLEESEQLAQRAYNSRKKLLGEEHPYTYKAMHHLGRVKAARGQYEEAHKISLTALGGMRVVLGTTHPDVSLCDIDLRQMEAKMEELGIKRKGDEAEEGEVIDT